MSVWISKEKPEAEIFGEEFEIDIAEFYNEEAIENVGDTVIVDYVRLFDKVEK